MSAEWSVSGLSTTARQLVPEALGQAYVGCQCCSEPRFGWPMVGGRTGVRHDHHLVRLGGGGSRDGCDRLTNADEPADADRAGDSCGRGGFALGANRVAGWRPARWVSAVGTWRAARLAPPATERQPGEALARRAMSGSKAGDLLRRPRDHPAPSGALRAVRARGAQRSGGSRGRLRLHRDRVSIQPVRPRVARDLRLLESGVTCLVRCWRSRHEARGCGQSLLAHDLHPAGGGGRHPGGGRSRAAR